MKTTSATEAKRSFSALLRKVQQGETVIITLRGRPVAQLEPIAVEKTDPREEAKRRLLEHLEGQPVLNRGPFPRHEAYEDDEP